jgi:hypothetical protein
LLTIGDPDKPATRHGGKPFNRPTHVALRPWPGDLYVSDGYGNSRVHKFDPRGRHLFSWGEPGTDAGCQHSSRHRDRRRRARLRRRPREPPRSDLRRSRALPRSVEQPAPPLRPVRRLAEWRALLRRRAADGARRQCRGAEHRCPGRHSVRQGDLVARIGDRCPGEACGQFTAPHACAVDSRGSLYVAEVAWTACGSKQAPPREIRSLQKFELVSPAAPRPPEPPTSRRARRGG